MSVYCKLVDITKTSASMISGKIVGIGCRPLNMGAFISEVGMPDLSVPEEVLFYSWLPYAKDIKVFHDELNEKKNRIEIVFDEVSSPVVLQNSNLERKLLQYIHRT